MNFDVWFREQLKSVSSWIVEELDRLYAAMGAAWAVDHAADGTHGHIHALSVYERDRAVPMGEWIAIPYNAGLFSGLGGQTWTVDSADFNNYRYTLVGMTMTVQLGLSNSSVGGTPHTDLLVALPSGYKIPYRCHGTFSYSDNGTAGAGICYGSLGTTYDTFIGLRKVDQSNWTASANATNVLLTFSFEVVAQ